MFRTSVITQSCTTNSCGVTDSTNVCEFCKHQVTDGPDDNKTSGSFYKGGDRKGQIEIPRVFHLRGNCDPTTTTTLSFLSSEPRTETDETLLYGPEGPVFIKSNFCKGIGL